MNDLLDGAHEEYQQRGYHMFRAGFPSEQINDLANLIRRRIPTYPGLIRRNSGELEVNEFWPDTPFIRNAVLNLHLSLPKSLEPLCAAVRTLITSPALAERLTKLDGAEHYTIHQTILFISTPTTEIHIDSWSLDTVPHGFAHTVWIPLQDMGTDSGVPSVIAWPRGELLTEAALGLPAGGSAGERYDRYQRALAEKLLKGSPESVMPLMRAGDFIVWSSLTPHFTVPSQPWPKERLSLQVLLRPAHCTWGNFLNQPSTWTPDRALRMSERFSFLKV
jgi:Phytanoyl-CoA dioxygenase (PhyH)